MSRDAESSPIGDAGPDQLAASAARAEGSADAGFRIAAVDIGSNSIRLEVAESLGADSYRVLTDEKETVGLANTDDAGELEPERVRHAIDTVINMVETARGHAAHEVRLVATAAVRDAPNRDELLAPIRERTGLDIEVLSGDDEARYAHVSVANAFDLTGVQAAVLDIGGGSTEVAVSVSGVIERLFSAPIGAVRLTERFPGAVEGQHAACVRMRSYASSQLDRALGRFGIRPGVVFGTGGTFTTLAEIIMNERRSDRAEGDGAARLNLIRGFELRLAEVAHTLHRLERMSLAERRKVKGLSSERARIIVAGLVIVEAAMRKLGVNTLRVHDRGVRDGVLLHAISRRSAGPGLAVASGDSRRSAVMAFGRRCGFEEQQATHVAGLALALFDQMRELFPGSDGKPAGWATAANRELLEYGALLRDVGYFINYAKHHKHSYHLIIHSDLPGFTPTELQQVAMLARYHRKARPKKKHEPFGLLPKADRQVMKVLAGIVRLADGLDRTHSGAVRSVRLELAGDRLVVSASATRDPGPDLWGARRKTDVLQAALGVTVELAWAEEEGAA